MPKLTQLNIRYDPEIPGEMQNHVIEEEEYYTRTYPEDRKPFFPFHGFGRGGSITVNRFISISREHRETKGFDPYAGDEWTIEVGRLNRKSPWHSKLLFRLVISDLIIWHARLNFGKGREKQINLEPGDERSFWRRLLAVPIRWLYNRLEYRHSWWMHNEYVEDPMGSLSYWE